MSLFLRGVSVFLCLELPYPPPLRRCWRWVPRVGLVPSKHLLEYKAKVALQLRVAQVLPMVGDLEVHLDVYRPRAVGDLDNPLKATLDSGNGLLWLDDAQIVDLHVRRYDDARRPRVEVQLRGERYASFEEAGAFRARRALSAAKARTTRALRRRLAVPAYAPGRTP